MRRIWSDRGDVALGDLGGWPPSLIAAFSAGSPNESKPIGRSTVVAVAPAEMRDDVAERVVEDVPHVQLPGRVRQHLEHVEVRSASPPGAGFSTREGLLGLPDGLPLRLDFVWVVSSIVFDPRNEKASHREAVGGWRGACRDVPWVS